jgi:hypothetical protein
MSPLYHKSGQITTKIAISAEHTKTGKSICKKNKMETVAIPGKYGIIEMENYTLLSASRQTRTQSKEGYI